MTEPADHPLLDEPGSGTKTAKRRASTAKKTVTPKPRAPKAASKAAASEATEVSAPSPAESAEEAGHRNGAAEKSSPSREKKAPVRKTATSRRRVTPATVEEEIAAEAPAPEPAPEPVPVRQERPAPAPSESRRGGSRRSKPTVLPPGVNVDGAIEEWRPSARRAQPEKSAPVSKASSAPETTTPARPANGTAAHAPESAPAPAASAAAPAAAPAAESAPARKYPVYIPRHVARQMEEQGQTAPIAVPADAVPEAARAAVEAAEAARAERVAQHTQRAEARAEARPERGDRPERAPRGDRFERGHRGPRPEPVEPESEESFRAQGDPPPDEELGHAEGIVEISGKGFGFIRDARRGFAQHPSDVFVTPETVRRYNLRDGQWLTGETRRGGRGSQLHRLTGINGDDPETSRILPAFDELTVISPMERITMETTPERNTTRLIDLFTPIGKGQRGLIVAPPRTGKTTLLQHIADAVVKKHPDIVLIILLVDERPEEVTDIKRTVPNAEVMASSNDSDVKSHTRIAQLAIERAKRLVESGKDVFVLLDSITRVGRAFNNAMAGGGRTMSGGVDARALEIPRRLFAAARNTEEAGSMTIIATALIETGSRMDELIFQEFKGTGNMELVLDRKMADQRIYPAIDMFQSGTRREELLIPADDLHKINILRRGLAGHKPMEAIDRLLFFLRKFPTNAQMLKEIPG